MVFKTMQFLKERGKSGTIDWQMPEFPPKFSRAFVKKHPTASLLYLATFGAVGCGFFYTFRLMFEGDTVMLPGSYKPVEPNQKVTWGTYNLEALSKQSAPPKRPEI